ncbi:MAG: hypothetical protein HC921_06340 [Synechococcaceae cyanobacterium SM2_3_1]|nr:hypothetical protein [Synechococcaceae cyanobacterium SM2_3_1]
MNTVFFQDRTAVIATMHRKEQVIEPILTQSLGIRVQIPSDFNTDSLGTFTGEIPRPGSQIETARKKARMALQVTGHTLGIASEGSFGPHPFIPWEASDLELVVLLDLEHDLEIVGQALSTHTNYQQQAIRSWSEAEAFAQKVGFPEHGLIVRSLPDLDRCVKGIILWETLSRTVEEFLSASQGLIRLETDMRALFNPTRMLVIEAATRDLVQKIQVPCPQCGCPGFGVTEKRSGLPCSLCHLPTANILKLICQCQKCQYREERLYPDGKTEADPATCSFCNP